ncbi:hypothetical protein BJX64DRAFT_141575 [Aspergillus heterothallicus]
MESEGERIAAHIVTPLLFYLLHTSLTTSYYYFYTTSSHIQSLTHPPNNHTTPLPCYQFTSEAPAIQQCISCTHSEARISPAPGRSAGLTLSMP